MRIGIKEAIYLAGMLFSVAAFYYSLDSRLLVVEENVRSNSKVLEIYNPAVLDAKLDIFQQDLNEIKDILKDIRHDRAKNKE